MISFFSKNKQNFIWLSQIINAHHDFYVVRIRWQEKVLFELEIAYLSLSKKKGPHSFAPEPGISGLEKAAPPGELEFCSRSN